MVPVLALLVDGVKDVLLLSQGLSHRLLKQVFFACIQGLLCSHSGTLRLWRSNIFDVLNHGGR